jgi:phosphomannomutase/phosphoglucomutase
MVRVGHSYIYSEMLRIKALLAGEYSGHLFYRENYGVDDAMFGAAKMCELVALHGSLAKQRAAIPKLISTPAMRPHVPDKEKFQIAQKIVDSLKTKYGERALTIDGVRLELPKAWGLLRPSNTGSEFVLRFEGQTQSDLDGIVKVFQDELTPFGIKLDLDKAS